MRSHSLLASSNVNHNVVFLEQSKYTLCCVQELFHQAKDTKAQAQCPASGDHWTLRKFRGILLNRRFELEELR